MFYFTEYYVKRLAPRIAQLKYVDCEHIGEDVTPKSYIQSSDGSVVSFQKTVVAGKNNRGCGCQKTCGCFAVAVIRSITSLYELCDIPILFRVRKICFSEVINLKNL